MLTSAVIGETTDGTCVKSPTRSMLERLRFQDYPDEVSHFSGYRMEHATHTHDHAGAAMIPVMIVAMLYRLDDYTGHRAAPEAVVLP